MDFKFDYKKNLQALSGYRIANPKPLDARTVVNTRADIAEFSSVVYPGLLVYVIAEKKFIVFNGTDWEDFKGSSSSVDDSTITQIQGDINDIKGALDGKALASDLTALSNTVTEVQSALNGKASTETVEALTGRVGANEGAIETLNGSVATLEKDVTSLKDFKDTVLSKSTVLGVKVKTDAAGAFEDALDENKVAKIDLSVYAKMEDVANLELTGSVTFETIDSIIGGTFVTE